MPPLFPTGQPLAMQHRIDLVGALTADAIARFPRRAKTVGVLAAAVEAGTVSGRECGGFIEKEQLGPASAAHHLAPAPAEFADAGQPGGGRPALVQQGLGRGVVDDAAVAGEQPAMRRRDDFSGWRDAVLQRHLAFSVSPRLRGEGRHEGLSPCTPRIVPLTRYSRISTSPRKRGQGKKNHAAPSRIGGWNDSAVSQGKKIQVSCDTSVMKVSTSGRPIGFAYTVAKCASGIISRTSRPVLPVSTRSSTINSPLPVPPPSLAVSAEMLLSTLRSPCLV